MKNGVLIGIAALLVSVRFRALFRRLNALGCDECCRRTVFCWCRHWRGPKGHWFSYYDKFQTDRLIVMRYLCSGFWRSSPKPDDAIKVGMIDLHNHNEWIELGALVPGLAAGLYAPVAPGSDCEVMWMTGSENSLCVGFWMWKPKRCESYPSSLYGKSDANGLILNLSGEYLRRGYGYASWAAVLLMLSFLEYQPVYLNRSMQKRGFLF